jgi:hypothetical protein
MTGRIRLDNVYGCGKDGVEVDAKAVGELIATLQGLAEAMENADEGLEHTMEVLERRMQALGLPLDRRGTAEYAEEEGGAPPAP